jgi:hypothetical protein
LSFLREGTNAAWFKFHVDMSGVYTAVEDGESEFVVSLVKFVSRMEERIRK